MQLTQGAAAGRTAGDVCRGAANSGATNWAAAGHMFLPLMTLLSWLGNGGGASVSHANLPTALIKWFVVQTPWQRRRDQGDHANNVCVKLCDLHGVLEGVQHKSGRLQSDLAKHRCQAWMLN